jgi:hypothetical protein
LRVALSDWEVSWRRTAPAIPKKRHFGWILQAHQAGRTIVVGWLDVDRNGNFHRSRSSPSYSVHRIWPADHHNPLSRSTDERLPELTTFEEARETLYKHLQETIVLWESHHDM